MNIIKEARENQTAIIKITVSEADYAAEVDKKLREYKRKANIPGFRPGMVPMGIINKMYRKGVVAETAYKMASDNCFSYIEKEGIDYMGDVMPSDEQGAFDFDNNTDHEFIFEVGLAPVVDLELTEKDKVTRYKIKVDEEMREGYRSQFLRTYGRLVDVDVVEKDEAVMCTLDNGDIKTEDAYVGLISMSDEDRKPYIGKKVGDQMVVNVNELYKSEQQRASVLGLKENELASINPEFNLNITKIRKYADPEMNDVGILASMDPVALDQACVDLVFNYPSTEDDNAAPLIERINSRHGIHILEHAAKIGLGSRVYELRSIDK